VNDSQKKPRRARGEGGVRWDERRQRFVAEKTVGYDGRGKRIVKTGSGKTESAALRALRERVRQYEAGLVPAADRYTVAQAVEDWLAYDRSDRAPQTVRECHDLFELHIRPHLGGRRLKDMRAEELDKWMAGLARNLGKSSLKQVLSVLRRSVERAVARGHAERNVVALVKVPNGRPGRPSKSLTVEQAKAVLENTRGHWMHPYIVVSLTTGLRTEEVRALTWDRVHLDTTPPHVEVWRSARFGGDTKTAKSRRTLALPAVAVAALRTQQGWQESKRLVTGARWQDAGLAFTTGLGTALRADNVRRDFRRALQQVPGIDPAQWTPQELRHSFVSVMSAQGVPLEEVSRLVGHSDTSTTETVYRRELRPVIQTGAQAIDAVFAVPDAPGWDMEPLFDLLERREVPGA